MREGEVCLKNIIEGVNGSEASRKELEQYGASQHVKNSYELSAEERLASKCDLLLHYI